MKSKALVIGLLVTVLLLSACTPLVKEIVTIKSNQTIQNQSAAAAPPKADNTTLNYCTDFCYFVRGGETSKLEFNQSDNGFNCKCYDYGKNLLISKNITARDLELYKRKKVQWENMPITYHIINEQDCGSYESRKIHHAFENIENATDKVVQFQKVDNKEDANIELTCKFIKDCYQKKIDIRKEEGVIYESESICNHEAGVATITHYEGFTIKKATIDLIGLAGFAETSGFGASGFYIGSCGHPSVEIHEILHTFGFGHTPSPESIMYYQAELVPYTLLQEGACVGSEKKIDQSIIDDLLFVYG
ncbi:MAG TPA: matrixin family metalloprotease [Candidatus Nanoarchaeia archaeon]|nr:matrixin family metalloprotease [Candidatus Nanoarchaeia archaeon]